MRPALVLGLDGATFAVLRPLAEAGRLPNLARLLAEGAFAPLASTTPAMTFPAWTSFWTGLAPGRHGLFDFTQKVPGAYALRFANAADRDGTSLARRVCDAGGSALVLGLPATFPPEPVRGLLVSGWDAPVSAGSDASRASDPALYRAIEARVGPWMTPDLDEGAHGEGWHDAAIDSLLTRIARKTKFALEALAQLRARGDAPDLACVVFSESDTVCHHYWRDHDAHSPRHEPAASAKRRGAVAAVYEALDAACGELRRAFGESAACFVLSDHGAGGAAREVVHLGRRLAECGLLARKRGSALDSAARFARDVAVRALPPRARERVFRQLRGAAARVESAARFAGVDWARSVAFSEDVNTQPGVWINLAGREAEGCVAPGDYERVRDDVMAALRDWKLPDSSARVVARAARREEIYQGPHTDRAPDVVVELAQHEGYGLALVPTPWAEGAGPSVRRLESHELAGGKGRGMNGVHTTHGIWIQAGASEARGALAPASIVDTAPTILRAMELSFDALDGHALGRARAYSAAEEALVAEQLRKLGYLE
ncbi:MAG: alkaline phosphatase family protein [Deltaproteobacteria bacterium]|nr:alkaline phosphatase family protein [Deltaproteobacteria bacterium]